jgi:glyoxylase-like metal-dependent hydrolase (beta-lactamase superfamily II)
MTAEIRQVAKDTYSLDCGKDPIFCLRQVAYLLLDDVPALIDPGSTSAASALLNNLTGLGFDPAKASYIIPTHIHLDHGGGAGYLAQQLPGAKLVFHPRGAKYMADPSRLVSSFRLVFGEHFEETLGPVLPVPEDRIHVAGDGEVIRLGKRELTIHFSPGHASHHIAIQDSLTGALFCGDALGYISDDTPDVPFPVGLPPFDPVTYLETIEKLARLSPKIICYAHHGARTGVDNLIRLVREICAAFGDIIEKALAAGEDDHGISLRILEYAKRYSPEAELPIIVEASVSGYIDYFRNRK